MGIASWIVIALVVAALVVGVRRKLHRDAITQDGANVGSAMLAEIVVPGTQHARFVIVRGTQAFRENEAFDHQGRRFLILSYSRMDDSSTVLRRFIDVTCAVQPGGDRSRP
jgi:hypothetical protein